MTKEQYDKWQADTLKTYMDTNYPNEALPFYESMREVDPLTDLPIKIEWRLDVPTLPYVKMTQE